MVHATDVVARARGYEGIAQILLPVEFLEETDRGNISSVASYCLTGQGLLTFNLFSKSKINGISCLFDLSRQTAETFTHVRTLGPRNRIRWDRGSSSNEPSLIKIFVSLENIGQDASRMRFTMHVRDGQSKASVDDKSQHQDTVQQHISECEVVHACGNVVGRHLHRGRHGRDEAT